MLAALHATVAGLRGDVERVTERLPDPNAPGPMSARDIIAGGD